MLNFNQILQEHTSPVYGEMNCFNNAKFSGPNTRYSSRQIGHGLDVVTTLKRMQDFLVFLGAVPPLCTRR